MTDDDDLSFMPSEAALVEAERVALVMAVEQSIADPRPNIVHEEVRAAMFAKLKRLAID